MYIFLALVLVPLIEIALFIEVGGWLGLWPTLAVVVLTALAGTVLLRTQGLATVGTLRARIDRGEDPSGPLAHGALILAAGLLLLTPGFFTDALALALLVPAVRAGVIRYLARRVVTVVASGGPRRPGGEAGRGPGRGAETVEGEFEVVEPDEAPEREEDHAAGRRRVAGGGRR